ncbi:MAG: FG-GAP-like repeat-containing protein, partial [Acidimicrobiales bacterium]
MRTARAIFAALLVGLGVVATGAGPASAAPTQRWSVDLPGAAIRESSPLAIDLDGGGPDVVVGAQDRKVYALNGATGGAVGGWPRTTSNPINSSPSAADVDGNGFPEVFVGSGVGSAGECSGGALYSFASNGNERFRYLGSDRDCANQAFHSTPALGDINRDGVADATAGGLGLSIHSVTANGAANPGWPYYADDTVFSSPALADVNGDGQTDVIIGGDSSPGGPIDFRGGLVRALNGNGTVIWEFRVNEIVRSLPAVGDIDGDGRPEIVFGTGDFWVRRPGGASDATKVFALNANGTLKWVQDTGGYTLGGPALADIDGNGTLDVAIATFEGPNPGRVFAFNGAGGSLPGFPIASGGGVVVGGISTADLNGDGAQDLLVPTGGGVFVYSGKTATRMFAFNEGAAAYQNSPVVTDVDGNGLLDIIVAGTRPNGNGVVTRFEMAAGDNAQLGNLGWPTFHRDARRTGSFTNPPLTQPGGPGPGPGPGPAPGPVCPAPPANAGYWLVASDGGIFSFCDATFRGSTG